MIPRPASQPSSHALVRRLRRPLGRGPSEPRCGWHQGVGSAGATAPRRMRETGLPTSCQIALKEWGSVLMALERGEQLVLVRKGGLIEPGSGFELLSEVFVFYPTFEHQTVNFLRPPYTGYLEEARSQRIADGQVCFGLCGKAVLSMKQADPQVIERLQPFHIYNDAFATQRLKWQPDQPLVITVVRAFRLASPQRLPIVSRYAGCKSWVELETAVSLEGATPILDDAAFDDRRARIRSLLS